MWGREDSPRTADVSRLTADECSPYEELRDHRIRPLLRLKREHIGFAWQEKALKVVQSAGDFQPSGG
ncbi:MAG TPA: hypothetical protein PLF79_17535 [Thauera sp.]|nr:hypothetical protein [Thauera sp.]